MFSTRILFLSVLTICAFVLLPVQAQNQQIASVVHTRYTISSKPLGEDRTIVIRVPTGYERSTQRFPVVVMLDAHAPANAMMASIIESQAAAGMMPEMILVGIQNTNRTRDLTPTKTDRPDSGGADKFLDFIETEVLPFVEKNYRTQPYRIFAGHSLAGLAVIYTLTSRPQLFNGYIAVSPVLHWDKNFVINKSAEAFKNTKNWKKSLFVTVGDEPTYIGGFNSFKDLLKRSGPDGLDYEFQHWTDEDHSSIVMRAYLAGMRKIHNGWNIGNTIDSVLALESHYSKLSKRFGYEIRPPEAAINQLGYIFLRDEKVSEAIAAFEKNVERYPDSANVYDSLGEALEKNGSKSKALANYEKAFKMAENRGETQLAQSVKANIDRLSKNQAPRH